MSNPFIEKPELFSCGYCDSLAVVLHEKTGWPLGAIVRHMPDEFDGEDWLIPNASHAVLVDPNDSSKVFDLHGYRPAQEAIEQCLWSSTAIFSDEPNLLIFHTPNEEFCSLFSSTDELDSIRDQVLEFIEHHDLLGTLNRKERLSIEPSSASAPQL